MPELPDYMFAHGREADPVFSSEESLYRRVPPTCWDDGEIDIDAIVFPDMSVTRSKYGPASSARWVGEDCVPWAVIEFQVKDVPLEIRYQGAFLYRMRPVHRPNRRNYPHSEVQVFESLWDGPSREEHITKENIEKVPKDAQQVWRERLLRKCRVALRPDEGSLEDGLE